MTVWLLLAIGLAVGSFLNVCIDRLPRGESLLHPPSHCEACGHLLGALDLVPVFSYLWLRGRCRYCGSAIPWRLPVLEASAGLLFGGLGHLLGPGPRLAPALIFGSLFLVILVVDLEQGIIPNRLVYPALPLALVLAPLWPVPEAARPILQALPGTLGLGSGYLPALAHSFLGGLAGFAVMLIPWRLYPGGMGAGDVKLAALVGLVTGFPLVLVGLLLSFIGGGVVGGLLLLSGLKGRKDPIPFGPFLALGGMAAFLWGEPIARWYLQSLRF